MSALSADIFVCTKLFELDNMFVRDGDKLLILVLMFRKFKTTIKES